MEHHYCAEYKHVKIRPLKMADVESLRNWRNNEKISRFLRPISYITPEQQRQWFEKYLQSSNEMAFAIEETKDLKRLVGSVSLYDFQGQTAEIGKIVVGDAEASGRKIGFYAFCLALCIAYQKLGLKKVFCEVHDENMPAKITDLKVGFSIVGEHAFIKGGKELEMVLEKDDFEKLHTFLKDVKIYEEVLR